MVVEEEIGKKIRELRNSQGMTLERLSEKTGFSKGYLSKVENSDKAPPVSTLIRITRALNVSLSGIFEETESSTAISFVKKKDREIMARNGTGFGYYFETIAHKFENRSMDPYVISQPANPGEVSAFQHKGEELLFLLEGRMKFFHGDKVFIMEKGDCVYFDASIPHYGTSMDGKKSKCLMVIYTPKENEKQV
ncbi:MAG: helix-turn-helix transcriptional regulator [Deltaproteobacteria bacterium]|nr:helix-turn-helix transcriptional regulator [Deltaproteobacteria bacterium]